MNEILVGNRAIEVVTSQKEFMIERMEGKLTDFRGPRCVLDGNEATRVSKWMDHANYWHTSPWDWVDMLEEMNKDPCVSGVGTWKNLP